MSEDYTLTLREYRALICDPRGHTHPNTPDALIRCGLTYLGANPKPSGAD